MPFFQMDDGFDSELAVVQAGTAAFGLYSRCGIWVSRHLNDGLVPLEIATLYGTKEWIEKLIVTGLWVPTDGGFMMPHYLGKHGNRPRAKVLAERKAKAERQARWLERKKGGGSGAARRAPRPDTPPSRDASQDPSKDTAPPPPTPNGVGVGPGPGPGSAAPAAYGDRTPAGAGSAAPPGPGPGPTQGETPAQAAARRTARERLHAGQEAWRLGVPYQEPATFE